MHGTFRLTSPIGPLLEKFRKLLVIDALRTLKASEAEKEEHTFLPTCTRQTPE